MKIAFAGLMTSYVDVAEMQEVAKSFVISHRIKFLVSKMKRGKK